MVTEDSGGNAVSEVLRLIDESGLSDDELSVLADRRCRQTLLWLVEHPETTLDEVAEIVTGFESAASDRIGTRGDRDEIRIDLYHRVLPKLDDHGYVDFDHVSRTVTVVSIPSGVRSALERADRHSN